MRLASLTESPTIIVNMLDDIDIDRPNTLAGSFNCCPIYEERMTKEDLAQQHREAVQRDSKSIESDWNDSLVIKDKYDKYRPQLQKKLTEHGDM